MSTLKLIPAVYLLNGKVLDKAKAEAAAENAYYDLDPVSLCVNLSHTGADELLIFELSDNDKTHDANINMIQDIADAVDIPLIVGGNVKRLEDVKKYLYAGASRALLNMSLASNEAIIKEAADRFGKEKIAIYKPGVVTNETIEGWATAGASLMITESVPEQELAMPALVMNNEEPVALAKACTVQKITEVYGISSDVFLDYTTPMMNYKQKLKAADIEVHTLKSSVAFSELKLNSDGMVPVVVQDYKTNEVLMLAYMNEEAFNHTLETGRMTYYSRSRDELWEKGLTSGHFQYVKSLTLDCDSDTILAKVYQVGAACHTGKRSCFFHEIVKTEYDDSNPMKVFEEVYRVILDRKNNPKEGSYTNYLFDKGIDKILKKVGEEATEIVIAAKNPDPKEIVYEISDFLYHVMVLMAEKDVDWKEITKELIRR